MASWISLVRGPALATVACFALEPMWHAAAGASGLESRAFFTLATSAIHSLLYVIINGTFLICDEFNLLAQYKLARAASQKPARALIAKTILEQAASQAIINPLAVYFVMYPLSVYAGAAPVDARLPPAWAVFLSLVSSLIVFHLSFYGVHRVLHEVPWLYRVVHKQHHEYTGSESVAAEYSHPLESLAVGFGCVALFPTLSGAHPLVFNVWLAWRLMETYEAHSGYCFSRSALGRLGLLHGHGAAHHDFHHTSNSGNFGFEVTDSLFGTMDAYAAAGGELGQWALKLKLGTSNMNLKPYIT